MISLKSKREVEIMREAGNILKEVFRKVKPAVKAGVTTAELDDIAEAVIREQGGEPAFKGYRGFPRTACISINEEVVHGIPGLKRLKDQDLVSFDIGAKVNGYYADAARTWPVGQVTSAKQQLIDTAREAMLAGLDAYQPGCRIGDLSHAIQKLIESRDFGVVRDYVGHGIGRNIHEEPQVPNYGRAGQGPRIEPGLVLAIEPMVTEGRYEVELLKDGWTVVTKDGKYASHYEDTIAFTESGYLNLTGE
ncbi:MAG: type I methionyl aminopeptidase [Candidatus Omnitrophica bacterium]|nr:type I methionyl aminopeptidase [Candidatus Omnitrophota bacterium]